MITQLQRTGLHGALRSFCSHYDTGTAYTLKQSSKASYILKQNLGGLAGTLGGATAGMHLTGMMVYFIHDDPEAGRPTLGPY
jgi:hypothetical protein